MLLSVSPVPLDRPKPANLVSVIDDVLPATSKLCRANLPGTPTDGKPASKLGLDNEAPSLQAANAGAAMLQPLGDFVMLAAGFTTFQAAY